MNKKKEDNTSVEASSKPKKKGRLDGMLDAMNKRSDPLTTHKVATKYFSSFRSERNIAKPQISVQRHRVADNTTAVDSAVTTAVHTKVDTAVIKDDTVRNTFEKNSLSATHTDSENKVYNAIKSELLNSGADEIRVGITRLKELTGLSDKTIRVAIKLLENKRSIIITKPSQGVYGRQYFLPASSDVVKKRLEDGIQIDWVSKHIIPR